MFYWPFGKVSRRARLTKSPLDPRARELFAARLRFWQWLSADERERLEKHVQVLLAEKRFEAAGGFVLDEPTRWLVAAQASLLLLHRNADYFPGVQSIVIYPKAFVTPVRRSLSGGAVLEDTEERAGESWSWGSVILAWDEIEEGLRYGDEDGYNVVLHEFAHALDRENGSEDGMPKLDDAVAEQRWASAFTPAFQEIGDLTEGKEDPDTFLDPYAAESPAEFFAVVVESFFESPTELRDEYPAVYRELSHYFRQDPAQSQSRLRSDSTARARREKPRRPRLS